MKRITLEMIYFYTYKGTRPCAEFLQILKLGKIGTSHGFILKPSDLCGARGIKNSVLCLSGDLGRGGRRNRASPSNLIV